jgi:prevent-host-death family protein
MKIGIRDLKSRAPQVVREVRETGESVEITYRGAVVARLTPAEDSRGYGDFVTAWKHFDDVVREIGKRGKGRKAKVKAGATWRRDL